jgi:hypothetical protein
MSKIDINLKKAKNNNRFSVYLANTFTSRAYYNTAELSYLSAKATYKGKENALLKAIFDDDKPIDSNEFLLETKKASLRLSFNKYKDQLTLLLASEDFVSEPTNLLVLIKHSLSLLKILKLAPTTSLVEL